MNRLFNLAMAFVATMILASSCNNEPVNEPVNEPEQDGTINFTATQFSGDKQKGENGFVFTFHFSVQELYDILSVFDRVVAKGVNRYGDKVKLDV